jgi:hypothetical protein
VRVCFVRRLASWKRETEGKLNIVICYGSRVLCSDGSEEQKNNTRTMMSGKRKEMVPRPGGAERRDKGAAGWGGKL